jgi:glycosyltransferase involved in cell wall biosynthesis
MHLIALEQEPTSLRGGQELNLLEICQSLSKRGHRITLLYEREGNLLERYSEFCDRTIRVNSYGFDRRRVDDVINFLPSLTGLLQIPTSRDSIVFSNVYHTVFYGYLLSAFRKLPLVCYLQVPPFDFNRQRLLGLKNVDKFIAVSNQTKRNWMEYGYDDNKIDVVLNGTDVEKFKPVADLQGVRSQWHIPAATRAIAFAGRLDSDKGVEVLIQAFAETLKAGAKAKLLLAGKPLLHVDPVTFKESPEYQMKYQQSLVDMATSLGAGDHVHFLGHITNTPELYQAADVVVVPSKWPDPCPRVVIEAMSSGTPVVASRVGGIPEVVTGEFDAHLMEPNNSQALAETLLKVMHWRDQNPGLGQRCREHIVNGFSIDRLVDGIEASLLKVLEAEVKQPVLDTVVG